MTNQEIVLTQDIEFSLLWLYGSPARVSMVLVDI